MQRVRGPWTALVAVIVITLLGSTARAGDGGEAKEPAEELLPRIQALADQVAAHDRADDFDALVKDAEAALALHRECGEKQDKERKQVFSVFRSLLKATREDRVVQATLQALGGTGDAAAAGLVRPYLRQRRVDEGDPVLTTAIEVAGTLHDSSFISYLMKLVEKSKHFPTAAQAMAALGHYGKDKHNRVRILESLVKTVAKCQPGGPPRTMRGSDPGVDPNAPMTGGVVGKDTGPGARWNALAPALPPALNDLTGRKVQGVSAWLDLYNEYKHDLDVLFQDE